MSTTRRNKDLTVMIRARGTIRVRRVFYLTLYKGLKSIYVQSATDQQINQCSKAHKNPAHIETCYRWTKHVSLLICSPVRSPRRLDTPHHQALHKFIIRPLVLLSNDRILTSFPPPSAQTLPSRRKSKPTGPSCRDAPRILISGHAGRNL